MPTLTKDICYERETQDFALYLDGQFFGYARTRREAEERLDALVYDRLTKGVQAEASTASALPDEFVDAVLSTHREPVDPSTGLPFEDEQAPLGTLTVATLTDAICEALDTAREKAAGNLRWMTALDSAANWLLQQEELAWDGEAHALHVPSASTPGIVYIANGACQCEAFSKHNACWHRAAARLVKRAIDLVVDTDVQALADEIALEAPEYADHAGEMQAEALLYALAWDAVADALKGERALFA